MYCKQQKLNKRKKFCDFRRFLMNYKTFPVECSVEQCLSLADKVKAFPTFG